MLVASYYEKVELFKQAILMYRKVVDEHGKNDSAAEAIFSIAKINEDGEKYDQAIAHYKQVVDRYPHSKGCSPGTL